MTRRGKLILLHIGAIAGIAAAVLLFFKSGIGCVFRSVTGIPCPTCGITRATFSLLRLDLQGAFDNHPLVFFAYPYLFFLFHYGAGFVQRLKPAVRTAILAGGAGLFAAVYIIRLALGLIP